MTKKSPEQQAVVGRVMHELKQGELKSSTGDKVRDPRQAIAIALSEAAASNRKAPDANHRNLARTPAGGRDDESATRAELDKEAARRNLPGRSRMNKAELRKALQM